MKIEALKAVHPFFAFLIGITLLQCSQKAKTPPDIQPNIVVIMADDQGWGDLSLNGNPLLSTPVIDHLGKNGLIFEHFFVDAVCSPTRAALLTGRYAVRGGVYSTSAGGERLDLDEITFAQYLQEAGYKTGAFGKWHNGMQPPYHPNARGFEEFYGYCSGHWGSYFDAVLEHNGQIVSSEGYLTDVLTDRAIDFIEQHQQTPFLVYLPLNTPHSPMQVPDQWWNKFANADLPLHRYSDREDPDHTRAAYAMAENIDWNVGRLVQSLERLNLLHNTLIVYCSDNGPNGWRWNGGMEGIKGHTNEGGVRSPLIMHWPEKIKGGSVVQEPVSVMDLFPTFLDIANIKKSPKNQLDGLSLKPFFTEEKPPWPDRLLVNHWRNKTSIRSRRFRLDHENQLFDMQTNPQQTNDVQLDHPKAFARLKAAKAKWEAEVLSELPAEDNRSFTIGHPGYTYFQLPAADGIANGQIKRSNRWPNCSFYTNWTDTSDSVSWEVDVVEEGAFEVILYYTCNQECLGTSMSFGNGQQSVETQINAVHDPPLRGMEHDRIVRAESYVKDFKPAHMGAISLPKGRQTLSLKAIEMPGGQAIDFHLVVLKRLE